MLQIAINNIISGIRRLIYGKNRIWYRSGKRIKKSVLQGI